MATPALDGAFESSFCLRIKTTFHDEALFQERACGVQQLIAEPHKGFPYYMYDIINDVVQQTD
eukprot:891987-Amphidinium_carterae.1